MKFLLDTHTFLWFIANNPELSKAAKELLEDSDTELFLSYASLWEIAIKVSLGKLSLPEPFEVFVAEQLEVNSIELLSFSLKHISAVVSLPFHHRDPFDRLLAAQSLTEAIPLVSRDTIFDEYRVNRHW